MAKTMDYQLRPRPYRMSNTIQHYEWGSRDGEAYISQFMDIPAEKGKPYAELWMGAHPNGSSRINMGGKSVALNHIIDLYPYEMLGVKVAKKYQNRLPFLLKILSAAEVLSLQAHPGKEDAKRLFLADPAHYPDDNHKPEMAIAISDFLAVIGFRPINEIQSALERNPELARFIGEFHWTDDDDIVLVKRLYKTLVQNSLKDIEGLKKTTEEIANRIKNMPLTRSTTEKAYIELHKKYPGDIGLLTLFLLNVVKLKPGEGIILQDGIPHAYLKGNVIECMANSDNVVRLGLTPKYRDLKTILEILDYTPAKPVIMGEKKIEDFTVYDPDVKEFRINMCKLEKNSPKKIKSAGPEIGLVMDGRIELRWLEGNTERFEMYNKGESFIVPAFLRQYTVIGVPSGHFVRTFIPE
ncbi:MAG TPA: mannose-6-phosphate isomerase, class I [Candidatus Marinimicrobia bacterium]|nr:mannose-6-phosphate isomerase, class I [Candidatus Neomarinimicrobiota bacterium]